MQPAHNPYDFITNPAAPPKKSLFGGGGMKQKILMIAAAGTVLVILLTILASVFGGGESNQDLYWKAIRQHAEVIRVSELGSASARNNAAKNLAINTRQTLQSQQTDLYALAAAAGIKKINPKDAQASKDTSTDDKLTKADQLNEFDQEFMNVMKSELQEYQSILKEIYDKTKSEKNKSLLSGFYSQAQALIDETSQTSTSGSSAETPATS